MTNKNEALQRLIGSYFSDERDQQAAELMLEEFGRIHQENFEIMDRALANAWAGFINLSADMEHGPLRKQMRDHATRINAVRELLANKD